MDNAFEMARAAYGTGAYDDATLEFLFPQLKESEDDRIRKEIISALKFANTSDGVYNKHIAYLEKQKEQKPAEWSEEDSKRYVSIRTTLETSAVLSKEEYDANVVWFRDLVNAKKYSGPKPHWKPSEEELVALKRVGSILRDYGHSELAKMVFTIEGKLANLAVLNKSIWKPSEEQMKALNALNLYGDLSYVGQQKQLISLYQDLKKLM